MKRSSYIPVIIIIVSLALFGISSMVESLPLSFKLGFVGKIGLIVGVVGLWLFTLMPMWSNKKNRNGD